MKRLLVLLLLVFASLACQAAEAGKDHGVMISGKADKDVPGWTIFSPVPDGWTNDCCMYAKAIGVDLVLYQGEWTGDPERVMVLNVWPSKLSSLEAELQDDKHRYFNRDAMARVDTLVIDNKTMACRGIHYQGTDHKDDLVVFCDPGLATGIRLSWSMTLAHDDPNMASLIAAFQRVAERSKYLNIMDDVNGNGAHVKTKP